jgi:hypothetical protein
MSEFKARAPDYKGDGIAVWVGQDKAGKPFLKVSKPEWSKAVFAFKNEPKPSPTPAEISL